MDVTESFVQDPAAWDNVKVQPQTAWRVDRMKNMTYTQFWQLVKERRVDKVSPQALSCLFLESRLVSDLQVT